MRMICAALILSAAAFPASATTFEKADLDGDGFVSEREFAATQNFEAVRVFNRADLENDGLLTPAEFRRAHRLFSRTLAYEN